MPLLIVWFLVIPSVGLVVTQVSRRWLRSLHWGQLIMLLAVSSLLIAPLYMTAAKYGESSTSTIKLAYEFATYPEKSYNGYVHDSATRAMFLQIANEENGVSLRFFGAMLTLGLMTVATLWTWFGARKRRPIDT